MESLQEFLDKKTNESFNREDVKEEVIDIKRKLQDLTSIVEDNPEFREDTDRAQRVIYHMLGDVEFLEHLVGESLVSEGTWALPTSSKKRYEDGTYFIKRIEDLKDQIYNIFGDDGVMDGFDQAIERIRELMMVPAEAIEESINEDVTIPPELSTQYLSVKKQTIDKQTRKDQLMKSVNQVDNEINILQKNLVAIETKAATAEGQEEAQQNKQAQGTQTVEVQGKVAESIDLDEWWKKNVSEALDPDEIEELEDRDAPVVDVAADPVPDEIEGEEEVGEPAPGDSLEGDYVFTLEIEDEGEEENIIAKFYKDEDDDYWKARVVQGSEEPIESMQFDPEMDKVDIIEKLGGMFDEVTEIDTDEYEEMLDDKEYLDDIFYDDIIKED
jgi:hypothetical protein